MTARDLVSRALKEIGVLSQGETASAGDATDALDILNELLNEWNADGQAAYNVLFTSYTLVPNLQPHTIGPSTATFTVTQRPDQILGANIVLTNVTPAVRNPLNIRDAQWWLDQTVQAITSALPTDLYYAPGWPNGSLYLWPIPTTAYDIELETRLDLTDTLALSDTVSLPPGYRKALILTLAENLLTPFGRPGDANLSVRAAKARGLVFANNVTTPRLQTYDAGMSGGEARNRPTFNYRTGLGR